MKVEKQNRFSQEYNEGAENMIKTGDKSISDISKDLEIPIGMLYKWYNKYSGSKEKKDEVITEKDKEVRILRMNLAEVSEEGEYIDDRIILDVNSENIK